MHIQRCNITLHETLFYATRELGRLYETGRYLHNYALTFALGFAVGTWYTAEQVPRYAEGLQPLNSHIYVTPAQPEHVAFQLATFKYGEEQMHVEMQQAERNTPSFGRAKELAPESTFVCYLLSAAPIERLPRWIRLGKWHSKALVDYTPVDVRTRNGPYRAACPLNPLDVPAGALRAFDIISMPPSSLVANAHCVGEHYALSDGMGIPVGMHYTFRR